MNPRATEREADPILYVGFYSGRECAEECRYSAMAAASKMSYVARSIVRAGFRVRMLCPSWSTGNEWNVFKGREWSEGSGIAAQVPWTVSSPLRAVRELMKWYALAWLFLQLLLHARKRSRVVVYHSPFLLAPVALAKRVIGFTLVLEVEEIYSLFTRCSESQERAMISLGDCYILASKLIREYFVSESDRKKPSCVLNGAYEVCDFPRHRIETGQNITVVYAGTVDAVRRGAINCVRIAEVLDRRYRVFILGNGGPECVRALQAEISRVNAAAGYQKCEYVGRKTGAEFDTFMSRCDIGVNPQEPAESYMHFAFPSKILSYLSHNVRTVTTYLDCLANSEFADLVAMVRDYSPERFALAVQALDLSKPFDAHGRIVMADERFVSEIRALLSVRSS